MKKNIFILIILLLIGCSKQTLMPDLVDLREEEALKALDQIGVHPVIDYQFLETKEEGIVYVTSPKKGKEIPLDGKVTIGVSKGEYWKTSDSVVIDVAGINSDDYWQYGSLVLDLEKETLSFNLHPTLSISGYFEEYGYAVVNDVYAKDIPLTIESGFGYDDLNFPAGEERTLHITIPVSQLDDKHPTSFILYLDFVSGGIIYRPEIFITASWTK